MFETDKTDNPPELAHHPTKSRNSASRRFKYAVLLGTLLSGTLLVWGFVEKVREAADRVN